MSTPNTAYILPISDLDLSRDTSSKLRLAGIVTAISPVNSSLIVLTDPNPTAPRTSSSLLIDLSLCVDQTDTNWKKPHPQIIPPELKTKVMVIGHLTQLTTPIDTTFLTNRTNIPLEQPQVQTTINAFRHDTERVPAPNRFFVLEAILLKPLDPMFDLALWNYSARLRSQHEWHSAKSKHKRTA